MRDQHLGHVISLEPITGHYLPDGQVHHGHIGGGHTERHSGQLAIKLGNDLLITNNNEYLDALALCKVSIVTLPTALAAPVELGMMF